MSTRKLKVCGIGSFGASPSADPEITTKQEIQKCWLSRTLRTYYSQDGHTIFLVLEYSLHQLFGLLDQVSVQDFEGLVDFDVFFLYFEQEVAQSRAVRQGFFLTNLREILKFPPEVLDREEVRPDVLPVIFEGIGDANINLFHWFVFEVHWGYFV